ncbi:hypothetical protein OO5_00587 [Enterococcus faecalis V583]|nr:hypothetical protein OO5_00587 [Enterococcus faecalis V583]
MKKIHIESQLAPVFPVTGAQFHICLLDKCNEADPTHCTNDSARFTQNDKAND